MTRNDEGPLIGVVLSLPAASTAWEQHSIPQRSCRCAEKIVAIRHRLAGVDADPHAQTLGRVPVVRKKVPLDICGRAHRVRPAAVESVTPLLASTYRRTTGSGLWSGLERSASASASRPASRAIWAFVRRFGRYGK